MGSNNGNTSQRAQWCVGSHAFRPSQSLKDSNRHDDVVQRLRADNDLETAIRTWFSIPEEDKYVYYATASVQLAQVQRILNQGGAKGLHAWYWIENDGERQPLQPPPAADIDCYISIFLPTTSTASALKSFTSNAKRSSIRSTVANHLTSKRFIDASHPLYTQLSSIPKTKAAVPCNPYLDFWAWSCHALQWCGPVPLPSSQGESTTSSSSSPGSSQSSPPSTTTNPTSPVSSSSFPNKLTPSPQSSSPNAPGQQAKQPEQTIIIMPPHKSHPLLAIFMHHFGCAIPTHESLTILKILAAGRTIADVGSGNGYWTMMLRAYGASVIPVDSAQSEWRVNWLDHDDHHPPSTEDRAVVNNSTTGTVIADGAKWLSSQKKKSTPENDDYSNSKSKSKSNNKSPTTNQETNPGKKQQQQQKKGGKDLLLLIVYPITGPDGKGNFTRSLIEAYAGDTVAVVGTQNRNGYTGFKSMMMDEYMELDENKSSGWKRVVQIPLPSFPGKDEALFVFQRKANDLKF